MVRSTIIEMPCSQWKAIGMALASINRHSIESDSQPLSLYQEKKMIKLFLIIFGFSPLNLKHVKNTAEKTILSRMNVWIPQIRLDPDSATYM